MCQLSILHVAFLLPKFIVFFVSCIISLHVNAESLIRLSKYSSFSQEHALRFQI